MAEHADTIDLADVVRSLRRGWRTVAGYTLAGVLASLAVLLFAPKQYEGTATVVLRAAQPLSPLARLGAGAALGSGAAALAGIPTPLETELQILQSGAVAERVIDSLRLQARVKSPAGVAPWRLLEDIRLPHSFRKQSVTVQRQGDGRYRVRAASVDTVVAAGTAVRLLDGTVVLRDTALPASFEFQLLDREDAVERFSKRFSVGKAGGEVARLTYAADDSLTAALVPNIALAEYLARRKTTERGVNQHRVEFLVTQMDSTEQELTGAERALRRFQESSGVIDATVVGKIELERGADLRKELTAVEIESGAISQLLDQVANGTMERRQLAAFPTFLKGSALNELITQLNLLEADRQKLLERRTPQDPEVVALTQSIASIEAQFVPQAQAYAISLQRRRTDLTAQLDTLRQQLGLLPGAAESGNRLAANVLRLNAVYAGLQAQLVEARLGAIGEGGEVHQLDVATAPKKPSFPRPAITLGAGLGAGLLVGVVAALALTVFGRWARDPLEIERATGVPTLRFDRQVPLIVANGASRTVLVVPLDPTADALGVAKQIVETAQSRATSATLLDLSDVSVPTRGATSVDVNGTINRLGAEFETVVVRLPALTADATLAALNAQRSVVFVVSTGRVAREQLIAAMQTLRRLDVPCAGIVVSGGTVRPELARGTRALAT